MRPYRYPRAGLRAGAATIALGLVAAAPAAAQDLGTPGDLSGGVTSPICTVAGTILGPNGRCVVDPNGGVPGVGTLPGTGNLPGVGPLTGNTSTGGSGGGGTDGRGAEGDSRAPRTRLAARKGRLSLALRRGYSVVVFSDEACTIAGTAAKARSRATLARGQARMAAPGKAKLRLRFTSRARRALRRVGVATLTVRVTVTDAAGNAATKRIAVRLKR